MARANRGGIPGASMSRGEVAGGCIYLPVYIVGLGWLMGLVLGWLDLRLPASTVNILYFLFNFLAVALIFRRWLIASLGAVSKGFWAFIQAAVLGLALYYALSWVTAALLGLLELGVSNPNDAYVDRLIGGNLRWALVCTVLLAPLVEETLFRGLIFGNLRVWNRLGAYLVSALAFAVVHVWQYVGELGWGGALLCLLQYLPAGAALGWTYERAGTIWASILAHAVINAVAVGLL